MDLDAYYSLLRRKQETLEDEQEGQDVALHNDIRETIDSLDIAQWSEEFYGWCSDEDGDRLLKLIFATKGASLAGCKELCIEMRDLIENSVYDTLHDRLKGK